MSRKNCFIKISGDMLNDIVFQWVKELSQEYFVVICVGGGTQINEAFKQASFPVGDFGPLGRETKSFEERQLARNVLEKNQSEIQDRLAAMGVQVIVIIPVLDIGTVLCHINGDEFLRLTYNGFDVLYAVTTKERVVQKQESFKEYPKIRVVGF